MGREREEMTKRIHFRVFFRHSRESGNLWLPIDSGSPFVDGDDRGGGVIPAEAGIQSPLP